MADMAEALRLRALGIGPVAAIVGTKVHWNKVPQGTAPPYVVLTVPSDPRSTHMKGRTAFRDTRVQAECCSLRHAEAFDLAEKLVDGIEEPATQSGIQFGFTQADGPRDAGGDVDGVGFVHRAIVDLMVRHGPA